MGLNNKTTALEQRFYFYDVVRERFVQLYDGFTFGRTEGNESYPSDLLLSRQHIKLHIKGIEVSLEDLNSTNRTRLNSEEIEPMKKLRLRTDDVIEIGNQKFVFTPQCAKPPVLAVPAKPRASSSDERARSESGRDASPSSASRSRSRASRRSSSRPSSRSSAQASPHPEARKRKRSEPSTLGILFRPWTWHWSMQIAGLLVAVLAAGFLILDFQSGGLGVGRKHPIEEMLVRYLAMFGGASIIALSAFIRVSRGDKLSETTRVFLIPVCLGAYFVISTGIGVGVGYYDWLGENAILQHCVTRLDEGKCQNLIRTDYRAYYALPAETRASIEQSMMRYATDTGEKFNLDVGTLPPRPGVNLPAAPSAARGGSPLRSLAGNPSP